MGKLIAIEHLTLDGVMQAPARSDEDQRDGFAHGGWADQGGNDPAMQQAIGKRMGTSWSLLAGRTTYQDFAKVWPARRPNPMSLALDNAQKFVASRTLHEPLPWQNSTLLKGDAVDAVRELKRSHDKSIIVFGSGLLLQSLMPHNLIDEYALQIHPIVLGAGRKLFPPGVDFTKLSLLESQAMSNGVIFAVYQPK